MTGATPFGTDAEWNDEDELDLADDESLPWLEAGEDEEQATGFDTSRMILLGVLALVLLGLVVGTIWFVTNQASDEPPADGSVIAAPEEPYKSKPDDPGGKTFAGTGDTSFAVGEGQTREGRLAEPAPGPQTGATPTIASTVNEGPRAPAAAGAAARARNARRGGEGKLQAAPTVNGPWQSVDAASPLTISADEAAQFGRAVRE